MPNVQIIELGCKRVHPGKFQPRDRAAITDESVAELAASVKRLGFLNPLIGVPREGDGPIEVDLVAGERRWRVARLLKINMPVRLVRGTDEEMYELSIVDNLEREDLTLLEEARALDRLQKLYGGSQRALAKRVHRSQPWVQQRLALLDAAPAVRELVNTRVFSLAHARALSGLPDAVQESAAAHLNAEADRGVALTSRQVGNLGRQVRQFLDPTRFEGVEGELMAPTERNGRVAIRYLLQTLSKEALGQAVQRLLEEAPGSEERKLLGKKTLRNANDVYSVARLLRQGAEWSGAWSSVPWWTKEIAEGTGRVCAECIFAGQEAPPAFRRWRPPCARWADPENSDIQSCGKCILPTDAVAIVLEPRWDFGEEPPVQVLESSRDRYVGDVETCKRLVEALAQEEAQQQKAQTANIETKREDKLRGFRQACAAADRDPDADADCPLDTAHFQAQWCVRCAFSAVGECKFVAQPAKDGKPGLYAMIQIELEEDDDGKKVRRATRIVPRCELFRFPVAPAITPTGWITFPPGRRERQKSAMRWLRVLAEKSKRGYLYYTAGLWSVLRWLPYDRPREEHYNLGRLVKYLLDTWDDEWDDGRIATLLTCAASESSALGKMANHSPVRLLNPETLQDEEWLAVAWGNVGQPYSPSWWPSKITWPFAGGA